MSSVKQLAAWNSSSSAKLNPEAFLPVALGQPHPFAVLQTLDGTDNGNFLRELYGATFFPYEARYNLAGPACRKPRMKPIRGIQKAFSL